MKMRVGHLRVPDSGRTRISRFSSGAERFESCPVRSFFYPRDEVGLDHIDTFNPATKSLTGHGVAEGVRYSLAGTVTGSAISIKGVLRASRSVISSSVHEAAVWKP
jgi:hypothetical protein